jgi:hypothetical protein
MRMLAVYVIVMPTIVILFAVSISEDLPFKFGPHHFQRVFPSRNGRRKYVLYGILAFALAWAAMKEAGWL